MDELTEFGDVCGRCERPSEGLFPYYDGAGTVYLCERCYREVMGV